MQGKSSCLPPRHLDQGLQQKVQLGQLCKFADELCRTLDDLIAERKPQDYFPYEDTLTARIQGKLMQYYDLMSEGRRQTVSSRDILIRDCSRKSSLLI